MAPGFSAVRVAVASALGLCAVVALAWAAPTVDEILARARSARGTANYTGVRRLQLATAPTTVVRERVYHGAGARERFEVIEPAAMAGRIHICDGECQWRYDPRRRVVEVMTVSKQVRDWWPPRPPGPGAHGPGAAPTDRPSWACAGDARIAGRDCYVVSFSAHGNKRRTTLYVDASHYVVLGLERRRADGGAGDTWRFEKVQFVQSLDPGLFTFKPPAGTKVVQVRGHAEPLALDAAERTLKMHAIVPSVLPPGFWLDECRIAVVRLKGRHALWMPFTNGAETFSIFQTWKLPEDARGPARATRWDFGPYTLLVVGKLTKHELEAMRQHLHEFPEP
jgi:outer membrane lipoprotein-sorting protein